MDDKLTLIFAEEISADAIRELQMDLREVSPQMQVDRVGADGKHQDFGSFILITAWHQICD